MLIFCSSFSRLRSRVLSKLVDYACTAVWRRLVSLCPLEPSFKGLFSNMTLQPLDLFVWKYKGLAPDLSEYFKVSQADFGVDVKRSVCESFLLLVQKGIPSMLTYRSVSPYLRSKAKSIRKLSLLNTGWHPHILQPLRVVRPRCDASSSVSGN